MRKILGLNCFCHELTKPLMLPKSIRNFSKITYEERLLERPYIGDQLDYDLICWKSSRAVAIKAPTGAGKTWISVNKIIPYAKKNGENVLIIMNRSPLNLAYKKAVAKICGKDNCYTDEGLLHAQEFDNVYIVNYQGLESFMHSHKHINFSYVICDECHYFLQDASFTDCTGSVLDMIPKEFKFAKRIYISATIEEVLPFITRAELYDSEVDIDGNVKFEGRNLIPLVYKMDADYSKIKIEFFEDTDYLCSQLKAEANQVLAFCDTKKECKKFVEAIGGGEAISSEYLRENPDVLKSLVENEGFEDKCLAATTVFSNGNNISRKTVRSVVITLLEQVEILQMAGRRRLDYSDSADGFTLYLKIPTVGQIKQKLHSIYELQKEISACKKNYNHLMRVIKDGEDKMAETIRRVFEVDSNQGRYKVNYLCEDKLYIQQKYLEYIAALLEEEGSEEYCRMIAMLFGKEFDESMLFKTQSMRREELKEFVLNYGFPLDEKKFNDFCCDFMEKRIILLGKSESDNFSATRKTPGLRSINNRLSEFETGLKIVEKDEIYCLEEAQI